MILMPQGSDSSNNNGGWKRLFLRFTPQLRLIGIILCAAVLIWSAYRLISYAVDYFSLQHQASTDAAAYHSAETTLPVEAATEVPTEAPRAVPTPDPSLTQAPTDVVTAQPTPAPTATYDPFGGYPNNPYRTANARFDSLRGRNKDIIGWLTVSSMVDAAIVQRDNSYYLRRDYLGEHNTNGAIFLDEQIDLKSRPDTYILYGHNMKTGAMFGNLRKFDSVSYLRTSPVITFDTIYEDGQFAVFASCEVSLDSNSPHFVDFYNLPRATAEDRTRIISRLQFLSAFSLPLDVSPDDQLLLLVTCTGDDNTRRLLAARRLREDESAQSLNMTYLMAETK